MKERTNALSSLRAVRAEIAQSFKDLRGVDYGVTVGVYMEGCDVEWFDVVLVTFVCVSKCIILYKSRNMV